jgi:hypothetical protein
MISCTHYIKLERWRRVQNLQFRNAFRNDFGMIHPYHLKSMTSAQRAEACGYLWTPPQLGVPGKARRFGFFVRGIRDE